MRDLSREQNPKQKGTLPSDTIANPKGSGSGQTDHIMAITNRSGKVLQGWSEQVVEVEESVNELEVEEPSVVEVEKVSEELKVQEENREEVKEKKEDPGDFTIPYTIRAHEFARALCDNGASIKLMPLAIYKQTGLDMPRPTSMRLQMANRSIKRLVEIIYDVLVKVGKFYLPADFVILDCVVDKEIPIILARPFLATIRALIDSEWNEIKFRVNDEEVKFQARKGMKLPHEYESISVIDVVDEMENAVEMKMEGQCLGEVEQLLDVLKENRQAIGWTIADIRGIPTRICEHKIQLESIVLGHKISKHGIEVDRAKIEIISKIPPPTSVKGVRSFLGHAGFYRRFIKDFPKIANPMCKLLEKDAKFVFDEK
uniref:Mitochondrial protein n=1 Tax=Nicotiana tabacum TaxID=4097 RepID=A0A1S4C0R0_TOBAC|nr:PREDICTED: uncharacterized protein LOC107813843 [Nicotiana tabacum]